MTDELTAEEIIRRNSLKKLENSLDKVRQAIDRTISATIKANYNCDFTFCVSWGVHLWYVCDLNGVVDGPYTKEKAYEVSGLMNMIAKGANNGR